MVWQSIGSVSLTKSWQFLQCPADSNFVRLTHVNLPPLPNGFICQADVLSPGDYQILNPISIGSNVHEIYEIAPYSFFSDRHLGFKQIQRISNNWDILVEVIATNAIYDLSPASLNLLLQSTDSLQTQITALGQQISQTSFGAAPVRSHVSWLPFPTPTGLFMDGIFWFNGSRKVGTNFSIFKVGIF